MRLKAVSGIMLKLMLTSMLTLAFNTQPVKAEPETIYVDDDNTSGPWDGTQGHPYQNITSALEHASINDTIYVHNGTYYENPVVNKAVSLIGENKYNTIIDGRYLYRAAVTLNASSVNISGFTIRKGGYAPVIPPNGGILILGSSSGNNITNNIVTNNTLGIYLSKNSRNNVLAENTILYSNFSGIWLFSSNNNNSIFGNSITANNWDGIDISYSLFNTIYRNNVTNNGGGIRLETSSSNSVYGNNITANKLQGGIYLCSSDSNSIYGNSITANNYNGIWLEESSNNTIYGNSITANERSGILLYPSSYNTIYGNNLTKNGIGIRLEKYILSDDPSNYNSIYGNSITANGYGVRILYSSFNTIYRNNLTKNAMGITLEKSSSNSVYGNNIIASSWYGIDIFSSSNNIIYHNNFVNHTNQVFIANSVNVWDDGYPSGGNYWSDYNGTDLYSGPNQNETGGDGIWDTPYIIDESNQDNYPLVRPYRGPVRNLNTGQSYPTIQEGINNAREGDVIFALSGTYYEQVVVNKSVSLTGEGEIANTVITWDEFDFTVCVSANNVTISGFEIQNWAGAWAIMLNHSSNSIVKGNIARAGVAILVEGGSGNNVSDNEVVGLWGGCVIYGLLLTNSHNNVVTGNYFSRDCHVALDLCYSDNNYVAFNYISGHFSPIPFLIEKSNNNLVVGNSIWDQPGPLGGYIFFDASNSNVLYYNNFLAAEGDVTPIAIVLYGDCTNNTWDNGYPSGGNYWSHYNGTDFYTGPHQNETGRDGIGDIPYVIDENNKDSYPLIYPYGYVPTIDVNEDGIIDIVDIVTVALAFGTKPGDLKWNPYVDLNQDGIIDIVDIVMIAIYFGETWPPETC